MAEGRTHEHVDGPEREAVEVGGSLAVDCRLPSVRVEVLSWLARGMNGQRSDKAVWDEPIAPGESLGDLMDRLAGRFSHFADFYEPSSRILQEHVELVVNGRLYDLVGGFDTQLAAGDTVLLFPGFSGG